MPISLKGILLEYSEKIYKELTTRYKKQNVNLDEEIIHAYITRFAQLAQSIRKRFDEKDPSIVRLIPKEIQEKNKYLDILQWHKFTDLEKIVDIFPVSKSVRKKALDINMAETDADKIYNKDGIEVYRGDSENRCIKYSKNQRYSWCISRAGTQNMYNSYRFSQGTSRMFYFVFDRSLNSNGKTGSFEDPYHVIVIHVFERGTYAVSTANNSGDRAADTWDELGKLLPSKLWARLKPLKALFKFIPPSQEELELAAIKGKKMSLEQFRDLSHNTKVQYIQATAKDGLTSDQFKTLDFELKNLAINYGRQCSFNELKSNVGLLKRYPDVFMRFYPEKPLPYEFIPYLKEELQRDYYKRFEEDYLTFNEIEKYFSHNILNEYIAKQITNYDFLPEKAVSYMDNEQKKAYAIYNVPYKDVSYQNDINDDRTIAPQQIAMIPPLSHQTYSKLEPEEKEAFVKFLRQIGSSHANVAKHNKTPDHGGFFTGVPLTLEIGGRFYFVMSIKPDKADTFCICDETGKIVINQTLDNPKVYKDSKDLPESPHLYTQVGSKTFWIPQNEFTKIKGTKGEINRDSIKESVETTHKLKYLAGIIL